MRADVLIRHDGFKALFDNLDPVEAERFIVMVRRDNFDYTEWRKSLWEDLSVEELAQKAAEHWNR
jgi:hypothetical protein